MSGDTRVVSAVSHLLSNKPLTILFARDIKGANQLGLISVWLDWAPRRRKVPAGKLEVPQYIIEEPLELLPVIESLEREYAASAG